jgi:hypothetical protein
MLCIILVFLRSVLRLLVKANVVPSSPILVTLMAEALRSSDTSVVTRATRRNVPEEGSLQIWYSFVMTFARETAVFEEACPSTTTSTTTPKCHLVGTGTAVVDAVD